jgi:hypothetical protein
MCRLLGCGYDAVRVSLPHTSLGCGCDVKNYEISNEAKNVLTALLTKRLGGWGGREG